MSSFKILSTEPCGDLIAVSVEVESDEIFSVNWDRVDAPVRGGQFHQSLHNDRVTHAHNRRVVRDVVYIEPPFSEEKVAAKVEVVQIDVQRTQPSDFVCEQPALQERCFVNGEAERDFYRTDACPQEVLGTLTGRFRDVDPAKISLISTPSYHEVLKQNVISTFLWEDDAPGLTIDGMKLVTRSHKFCLESGGRYDRLYVFPEKGESHKFLPRSARLMAKSVNTHADGLRLPDFSDFYFGGDHQDVQQHFGLPPKVGAERTYYGATVVNGDVVRVKQYCYDTPGVFYDWDGAMKRIAEAHGVAFG